MQDDGSGLWLRGKLIVQCIGRFSLTGVRQNQVFNKMYGICDWVELQVLNTYEEYMVWDTEWSHRHVKAKHETEEFKDQCEELKEA